MELKRVPTHIGIFFREEFLAYGRITASEPWGYMGIGRGDYRSFLTGGIEVDEGMLLGLEDLTGVPYEFWYNMNKNYCEWLKKATLKDYLDNRGLKI